MLVNQFLSRSVDLYPDKEALVCPEGRYQYQEIGEKVKEFSNLLLNMNVNKSDRVMIFLENSLESVVSVFGILEAGGVFVVINPQMKSKKMEYIINDCGTKILITDRNHLEQIRDVLGNCNSLEYILLTDTDDEEIIIINNRKIKITAVGINEYNPVIPASPDKIPAARYFFSNKRYNEITTNIVVRLMPRK